jgi:hypothetical protein
MAKERSLQKGDDMSKKNRPDLVDVRPKGALFSGVGSTGWRRRRDISMHKGNMKEGEFSHLHDRFTEEEA